MRASQWIAVAAVLLASGSAYAGNGYGHDDKGRTDDTAEVSSPRSDDVKVANEGSHSAVQSEEARKQEMAGAKQYPVTVDSAHPGGLFPWGG